MNTKVEEALGVLDGAERSFVVLQQLVVMVNAKADYIAAANEMRAARTTIADYLTQQDATIARLERGLATIRDSTFRNAVTLRGMADYTLNQEKSP